MAIAVVEGVFLPSVAFKILGGAVFGAIAAINVIQATRGNTAMTAWQQEHTIWVPDLR